MSAYVCERQVFMHIASLSWKHHFAEDEKSLEGENSEPPYEGLLSSPKAMVPGGGGGERPGQTR